MTGSGRAALGVLLGLAGHALALGVAFLAGRLVEPSAGGGFEDLAAVVASFLVTEIVVLIAGVVAAVLLARRGNRDTAVGLVIGWVLGLIGVVLFIRR